MNTPNLYIVIPAYNEEYRLPKLIKKLNKYICLEQIIVVDDGSIKPLARLLPQQVCAVRHKVNLGKGMALKTGCELAIKLGAKRVILMDADGQHAPKELPKFIDLLNNHQVVFGARYIGAGMPPWRLLGNRLLNKTTSWLFDLKLHDVWCGYRAFRTNVYPKIAWEASDYSVDVEMAIKVGKHKFKHVELFIGTIYHDKGSTTGTSIMDGIKLLLELIIWRIVR